MTTTVKIVSSSSSLFSWNMYLFVIVLRPRNRDRCRPRGCSAVRDLHPIVEAGRESWLLSSLSVQLVFTVGQRGTVAPATCMGNLDSY